MPRLPWLKVSMLLFAAATSALAAGLPIEGMAEINQATQTCATKIADGITGGDEILCVQGRITRDSLRQFQALHLTPNLIIVADSPGGDPAAAVRIAFALFDLHPTIVVPHRCLLACADFLLVASAYKLVANGAVLGWGHGFAPFAAQRAPQSEQAEMHQAVDLQGGCGANPDGRP